MPRDAPTTAELLGAAASRIHESAAIAPRRRWEARSDAEELLCVAKREPALLGDGVPLTPGQRRRFARLVARRAAGEPMALIRGHVDFRGLRLPVHRGVFAPRLSSELLAGEVVRRLRRRSSPVAVDVATGVGPVALAVAHELPRARVLGCDVSAAAIAAARANRRRFELSNLSFHTGDLLEPLPAALRGRVDVISAHPPYVPHGEVRLLPREVVGFEPRATLTDGSTDGLGMVRRLATEAPTWLRAGGWVLLEVSPDRARAVGAVLRRDLGDAAVIGGRAHVTRVIAARVR